MRYTYIIKHLDAPQLLSGAIHRPEEIIARKKSAAKARKFLLRFGIQTKDRLQKEVAFLIPNTREKLIQINRIGHS